MSEFPKTFGRLRADHNRAPGGIAVIAVAILAVWCVWATTAQVTLYEVSSSARLERDAAAHPVQAPVAGRVVAVAMRTGQVVKAGEPLVDLDVQADALRLREEQGRARGRAEEVARLRRQADAERLAGSEEHRTGELAFAEAEGRAREAAAEARYAESELDRMQRLHAGGLVPDRELQKGRSDAERLRALVSTLETAARRVRQEQVTRERDRQVRLEGLAAQIASIDSEIQAAEANIERLTYEVGRRRVRAQIDGVIGEAAAVREGAFVHEGEQLGSIVSSGQLMIVAQFEAARVVGRIHPGQPATLRLTAYPWAQFGTIGATVSRVASELRDGSVRIELTLDASAGARFRGTLDHGMPGSVEVAAERLSPLALLLRTAGQALTASQ